MFLTMQQLHFMTAVSCIAKMSIQHYMNEPKIRLGQQVKISNLFLFFFRNFIKTSALNVCRSTKSSPSEIFTRHDVKSDVNKIASPPPVFADKQWFQTSTSNHIFRGAATVHGAHFQQDTLPRCPCARRYCTCYQSNGRESRGKKIATQSSERSR